jgi:hypothetical protein
MKALIDEEAAKLTNVGHERGHPAMLSANLTIWP